MLGLEGLNHILGRSCVGCCLKRCKGNGEKRTQSAKKARSIDFKRHSHSQEITKILHVAILVLWRS